MLSSLKEMLALAWACVTDPEAREVSNFKFPSGRAMSVREARLQGLIHSPNTSQRDAPPRVVKGEVERIGLLDPAPPQYLVRLRGVDETFRLLLSYEDGNAAALTQGGDQIEFHLPGPYGRCSRFVNETYKAVGRGADSARDSVGPESAMDPKPV